MEHEYVYTAILGETLNLTIKGAGSRDILRITKIVGTFSTFENAREACIKDAKKLAKFLGEGKSENPEITVTNPEDWDTNLMAVTIEGHGIYYYILDNPVDHPEAMMDELMIENLDF